jgi:flagellar export protein FliJ
MRRFVWRLQRVLDIRKKQEQIKTQELFALTEKLAQTHAALFEQEKILKDIMESIINEKSSERLKKQEFFLRNSAATDEQIKLLKIKIETLVKKQKEMVSELLKIRRSKEGLEHLREQAKKRYIEEQEKIEQRQLDETGILRFVRENQYSANGENDSELLNESLHANS